MKCLGKSGQLRYTPKNQRCMRTIVPRRAIIQPVAGRASCGRPTFWSIETRFYSKNTSTHIPQIYLVYNVYIYMNIKFTIIWIIIGSFLEPGQLQ